MRHYECSKCKEEDCKLWRPHQYKRPTNDKRRTDVLYCLRCLQNIDKTIDVDETGRFEPYLDYISEIIQLDIGRFSLVPAIFMDADSFYNYYPPSYGYANPFGWSNSGIDKFELWKKLPNSTYRFELPKLLGEV